MRLEFSIVYHTEWGQSVHVVLNYISNNGRKSKMEFLLHTGDGYLWTLETSVVDFHQSPSAYICYWYQVEDEKGKVLRREWTQSYRIYTYDPTKDYTFQDSWRDIPYPYCTLSESMNEEDHGSLGSSQLLPHDNIVIYDRTILFRVSAPDLRENESVAICGNHAVLGSWNPKRYLLMKCVSQHEWLLSVDVFAVNTSLEYKYVVINNDTRSLRQWETGENRTVEVSNITDNHVLVVDGGLLRVKDSSLEARITVETDQPDKVMNALYHLPVRIKKFNWFQSYDTYVFDLDGTLLNTLRDLAASCNYALHTAGMPERTIEEVRRFVGNGVKKLMERAIPGGLDNPEFDSTYQIFRKHYLLHSLDTTQPYPGIPEMLKRLVDKGKGVAVVSNKFYAATQELCRHFFPQVKVAIGERENIQKKPAPDTVLEALRQLGVSRSHAVYIGDSDVDIMTARNCKMPCISVLWGFRNREFLIEHGATTLVESPEEIF